MKKRALVLALLLFAISVGAKAAPKPQQPAAPVMASFVHDVQPIIGVNVLAAIAACGNLHCADLSGNAPSDAIATSTYSIYRSTGACPGTSPTTTAGFTKLNTTGITATAGVFTYADTSVSPNGVYCYIATQTQGTSESAPSNDTQATIPNADAPTGFTVTVQ
jgi:hypothetical protein